MDFHLVSSLWIK